MCVPWYAAAQLITSSKISCDSGVCGVQSASTPTHQHQQFSLDPCGSPVYTCVLVFSNHKGTSYMSVYM